MSEDTSRIPISKRGTTKKQAPKKEEPKSVPKAEPVYDEPVKTTSSRTSSTASRGGSRGGMLVLGLLIALLVGVGLYYGMIVKQVKALSRADYVVSSAAFFKVPVAKVNGDNILYTDYLDNIKAMEQFYASDDTGMPRPTDEQMSDYVLSRLVVNTLIADEAKKLKVTVDQATIDDVVENQIVSNFDSREAAEEEIMTRYGWDFDLFIQRIVVPTELEKAVSDAYLATLGTGDDTAIKEQAAQVLQQIKEGADFAEMAKQYGSDATKDNGGDLGWFGRGVMVAPFEEAAFSLDAGQLDPELVETKFGYHIIQVDDRRTTTDEQTGEEVEEVKARHILFQTNAPDVNDFREYMNQNLVNARIEVLESVHNPFADIQKQLEDDQVPVDEQDDTSTDDTTSADVSDTAQ